MRTLMNRRAPRVTLARIAALFLWTALLSLQSAWAFDESSFVRHLAHSEPEALIDWDDRLRCSACKILASEVQTRGDSVYSEADITYAESNEVNIERVREVMQTFCEQLTSRAFVVAPQEGEKLFYITNEDKSSHSDGIDASETSSESKKVGLWCTHAVAQAVGDTLAQALRKAKETAATSTLCDTIFNGGLGPEQRKLNAWCRRAAPFHSFLCVDVLHACVPRAVTHVRSAAAAAEAKAAADASPDLHWVETGERVRTHSAADDVRSQINAHWNGAVDGADSVHGDGDGDGGDDASGGSRRRARSANGRANGGGGGGGDRDNVYEDEDEHDGGGYDADEARVAALERAADRMDRRSAFSRNFLLDVDEAARDVSDDVAFAGISGSELIFRWARRAYEHCRFQRQAAAAGADGVHNFAPNAGRGGGGDAADDATSSSGFCGDLQDVLEDALDEISHQMARENALTGDVLMQQASADAVYREHGERLLVECAQWMLRNQIHDELALNRWLSERLRHWLRAVASGDKVSLGDSIFDADLDFNEFVL